MSAVNHVIAVIVHVTLTHRLCMVAYCHNNAVSRVCAYWAHFNTKTIYAVIRISIIKIKWLSDLVILIMEITILVKRQLNVETGPWASQNESFASRHLGFREIMCLFLINVVRSTATASILMNTCVHVCMSTGTVNDVKAWKHFPPCYFVREITGHPFHR